MSPPGERDRGKVVFIPGLGQEKLSEKEEEVVSDIISRVEEATAMELEARDKSCYGTEEGLLN